MSECPPRYFVIEWSDDVGAELERTLEIRRREGVVDDDHRAGLVRRFGGGLDVDDVQHRVRRRLEPDDPRALVKVLAQRLVDRVDRQELELVALRLVHLGEQAVDAAVDVVHADDSVAWVDEVHHRRHGAHSGAVSDPVLGGLE